MVIPCHTPYLNIIYNKFTYVWKRSPNPLLVEYPAHVQQSLNWFNYFLLEPHLFWQETTCNHPSEWNKRGVNLGSNTDLCSICYGSEQYPNLVLEGSSVHVSDWEFCRWSMKNWRNTNKDLSHAVTGRCLASNTGNVTLAKQSASVKGDLQQQLRVFWTIGTFKNCDFLYLAIWHHQWGSQHPYVPMLREVEIHLAHDFGQKWRLTPRKLGTNSHGQHFNQTLRNHRPLSTRGREGFLKACRQNVGRDTEKYKISRV